MLKIWHNPRCRKSRETLAILQESKKAVTIRLYLEDAPSELEIREILFFSRKCLALNGLLSKILHSLINHVGSGRLPNLNSGDLCVW